VLPGERHPAQAQVGARIAGDNAASVRLHERAGFALVGTMKEVGHKLGRWVDVRLMQLML
jgi:phosphinothricin acetyltransferase